MRLPVFIDEAVVDEDLQHVTPAARAAFGAWRNKVSRESGILTSELRACRDDARDGTKFAGAVKTYVPWPTGQWGTVMQPAR